MSVSIDEYVEAAVRQLSETLNRSGFTTLKCGDQPVDWLWSGRVGDNDEQFAILLDSQYPFTAPHVYSPSRPEQVGWHQNGDGSLCLWGTHALGDQPWLEENALVDRIREWLAEADNGWTGDMPQLDLEAYNGLWVETRDGRVFSPLLVIDDWPSIADGWLQTTLPDPNGLMTVKRANLAAPTPPERKPQRRGGRTGKPKGARPNRYLNALPVDLGAITNPFITPDQLAAALHFKMPAVSRLLKSGRPALFVVRYMRGNAVGFIGLWIEPNEGTTSRRCFHVAERATAQQRRAGWHADQLAERSVSVVGGGSIGSFVADLLHRSGIADMTVHDSDILLPGNLTRHSAAPACIGMRKPDAIAITSHARLPLHKIGAAPHVRDLAAAVSLLQDRDLVIDCTGNRLTWQLFLTASEITGIRFLHVAVTGHGQVARVDICPPFQGAEPLENPEVKHIELQNWEAGCGDPVSPTPPVAVAETAAMGARFAIRMLAGEEVPAAGEIRQLFPYLQ